MHDRQHKLLIVDDEETLREVLRFNLEDAGYIVDVAASAEEALTLDLSGYSLIILDIMMGALSGTQLAAILKKKESTAHIPVIFCTAKDSEDDMVAGLDLGADDYITKPYSVRNVIARVRTVLRRTVAHARGASVPEEGVLSFGDLVVSTGRKTCSIAGEEVKMPRKEFEILSLLLSSPGHIFSRAELLARIWPEEVVVLERVVDVNITRLRSKLGKYGKNIVTRPGYGYGFME